ncbi:sugar ABC transporter permease [Microbacterium sp. SSW1-49]|uniref:Sugar ABC transporter permease n=1 Tax=Microbacterium croceum TaxID=2851645 RepID=A0ABT0FB12_9MICO|nr:sugar ABC transporter permease [Microbacterium croceum]MCK2034936.1 sugar ABC transporter permease [Microbacterium croceum]
MTATEALIVVDPKGRRRASTRRLRRGWWVGLLFVAPATLLFAVFGVYTIIYGFLLSFARWNGFSPEWTWTGIDNYVDLLGGNPAVSPRVANATTHTVIGMIVLPVVVVAIGLALALLLNSVKRFRGFLRTVYFLPFVTAGIAVYYAWRFMYQPDGAVNAVLRLIGLNAIAPTDGFLGGTATALGAVLAVQVWSSVPIAMLLFLTGLQTVDDSVIEAARIDGASGGRIVWSIVVPLLNPITALVVVIMLRESLQNFQLYLLMTNGGPVDSSNTLGLQTYTFAFGAATDLGYASALGWILAIVAIVLAIVNMRILRSRQ